jgi:hypothetical protein
MAAPRARWSDERASHLGSPGSNTSIVGVGVGGGGQFVMHANVGAQLLHLTPKFGVLSPQLVSNVVNCDVYPSGWSAAARDSAKSGTEIRRLEYEDRAMYHAMAEELSRLKRR